MANGDQPIMGELREMIDFCKQHHYVYIWGASHNQIMLGKYLSMININVQGYIISKNIKEKNYIVEYKRLLDIQYENKNNIGFLLAISDIHFNNVLREISEAGYNFSNIYILSEYNKRTIAYKMTPRPRERMWIEVNLADHCNLNCQMCDHFAPLAEKTFLEINVFKRDMERLSKLSDGHIDIIKLQGGEPLLNDNLIEFIKITRELFPKAIIFLFTDGLLLKHWENHLNGNLWKVMHDYKVRLQLTIYPINIKVEEIEELAKTYDVHLDCFSEVSDRNYEGIKHSVKHPFLLDGNAEKWMFISCYQFNESITIRDGKIYTCPMIPYIGHFNKYFGTELKVTENDYLDIYKASTYEELAEFVTHRTDFCNYCNVCGRRVYDWKQSKHTIDEYID